MSQEPPPSQAPGANPAARPVTPAFVALVALALLAFYAVFTQRGVGASDWYGYYQEGLLFRQGRVTLSTPLPAAEFPAQAPLGFIVHDGRTVPQYTPGYPLLLALAGLAGIQFYVTPLVGVLSFLLMFRIVRRRTDPRTGLLFAFLWAMTPIVVWGSTQLMSDLVAATALMLVYELCMVRQAAWAGAALVFAIAVRPTDGLFIVFLPALLPGWRARIRAALGAALPAAAYGAYNLVNFGAPWRTGYMNVGGDLLSAVAGRNLVFYAVHLLAELGPVALLLAAASLVKNPRKSWLQAAWFAAVAAFYLFWRYPGVDNTWWWFRFVLPGLPPLYLLAADGYACMRRTLAEGRAARFARPVKATVLTALLAMPVVSVFFCHHEHILATTKGLEYRDVVLASERMVPAGAWLGSVEFSGSTRLYTPLHSFMSANGDAPNLVAHLTATGAPVYLLVEPWNTSQAWLRLLFTRFRAEPVHRFPIWNGVMLYRLRAHVRPAASP